MFNFNLNINPLSNTMKYLQLVDAIVDAINEKTLNEGDMLPSVNDLVRNAGCRAIRFSRHIQSLRTGYH